MAGLSPRVRGNLVRSVNLCPYSRSIPACAGEPPTRRRPLQPETVYPRVCGGTFSFCHCHCDGLGLSPRVRGNHRKRRNCILPTRSIPACAGEPKEHETQENKSGVYPRVCGGTVNVPRFFRFNRGLSPRVRGNRIVIVFKCVGRGSIPACAGEPHNGAFDMKPAEVYPRVCGGTWSGIRLGELVAGLSPRVRGNRVKK